MSSDTTWATVVSASDYYPFGLTMAGRNYQDSLYRYGFNGKEKDDQGEWGSTNYDYGERVYSPSIGRWLSIDPLQHRYPDTSPYAFVRNSPIAKIDVKGLWDIIVHFYKGRKRGKEGALILVNNSGEVIGIWKAGGRGSKSVQNLFPNDLAARRRTKNGDTPLGRWKISHWQKSRDSNEEKDYGFYRLWLTDFEGEEVDRDANTIRVHGAIAEKSYGSNGRNTEDGSLWNTKGCIRMSLIDAMDLYINTVNLEMEDPNESPGVLTTENALSDREVFSYQSGGENSIEINWDGKAENGEPVSSGVYFYNAEVTFDVLDPRQKVRNIKGWVHVF